MQSLAKFGRRLLGLAGETELNSMRRLIGRANELEQDYLKLPDAALQSNTLAFKARLEGGTALDQLLPEAFANCREAMRRFLGLRPFDVQLMGGIILHQGKIAEMATGEGKTLVAALAAYLNSLAGKGVHVATTNEYLARRDVEWMGKAYAGLGVTAGLVFSGQIKPRKRAAYRADITYSTFGEYAFDYLRDNMRGSVEDLVQRGHACAIIDEADSILIDEARTPLIISGSSHDKSELYVKVNEIVSRFLPEHFNLDRESSSVVPTELGYQFAEVELRAKGLLPADRSLFGAENQTLLIHLIQALRAHQVHHRDQQYIVHEEEVILVDASTGRRMPRRRLIEGQHQAIEAKEGVPVKAEVVTRASTTVQNYYRLYPKLSGMTGTAVTDADEFKAVYNLDVVKLPTNRPVIREDQADRIFRTEAEKHSAVIDVIREAHRRGQPILLGTTSIEKSEQLSAMLRKEEIRHTVLNAHNHEYESRIVADAGRLSAVTIATNMAGRGTDIQLGGNVGSKLEQAAKNTPDIPAEILRNRIEAEHEEEKRAVMAAGGLLVIGSERHHSRRIDNQLRGRSGRQGDPGRTLFILSLEDELMKNVEPDWVDNVLSGKKLDQASLFKAVLDKAQARAESRFFEIRKQLLKFDDVVSEQRKIIYGLRMDFMRSSDLADTVAGLRDEFIADLVSAHLPEGSWAEMWNAEGLATACRELLMLDLPIAAWAGEDAINAEEVRSRIVSAASSAMQKKTELLGQELMRNLEKQILLQAIDTKWQEHRLQLDQLRQTVGWRSYGRRDPMVEFKLEAVDQFEKLLTALRREVTCSIAQLRPMSQEEQLAVIGKMASTKTGFAD